MGGVTVYINNHPGRGVGQDENGYYYIDNSGGRVYLTDEWYPDPEGTYRKITHSLKGEYKIGSIKKERQELKTFPNLESHTSVSVFYWSGDNGFSNPLLIQLGEGENEYYTNPKGLNNWEVDGTATPDLRKKLDEQNCLKNKAHIVDLSKKDKATYSCPSCNTKSIRVYSPGTYYGHTIATSGLSLAGFKDTGTWQAGLPSLKSVETVKVYWNKSGNNPIVIAQQVSGTGTKWFRRNGGNVNTWTQVVTDPTPTGSTFPTPQITIDLSMKASASYADKTAKVNITVRSSHIGYCYYRYQHSLCGGPFKVTQVTYNKASLSGIEFSPETPMDSVSAYYYGDDPEKKENLLLIELSSSGSNTYKYFCKGTKDANIWTDGGTGKLTGQPLRNKLDELKKKHPLQPPKSQLPPNPPTPEPPKQIHAPSSHAGRSPSPTTKNEQGHHENKAHIHNHSAKDVGKTPTSAKRNSTPSGVIAAGVVGGIVCVVILSLLIWRIGPSLKTYMASRRRPL
ncbi:hypothetical protein BEWA_049070 [Theileria equi strain WA]|uniref:Uncharacterized protein n=1 Tax=Theileria equi strain WA TaxID=1537102 RepID=L1LAY2_THEEQ|nr:hypothetical protein BEWA_049070 [Theileria equi strain WA]EKX72440.1 hypothetical protein BEWA_049070 [Theileria equi strain WA]|eukprot:XP_004831892.1 hypothetical protein BEWA_049070 [Theileria equi strain WA]